MTEHEFILPGLLPAGLSHLRGRHWIGKSTFATQLALAAAAGSEFLGLPLPATKTLLVSLEDTLGRCRARLHQCLASLSGGSDPGDLLELAGGWPCFDAGAEQALRKVLAEGIKLIIFDTYMRLFATVPQMKDLAAVTRTLCSLRAVAAEHRAAILLIDHRGRVGRSGAFVDQVEYLLGKGAAQELFDAVLDFDLTKRDRANLRLGGCTLAARTLPLLRDKNHCLRLRVTSGPASPSPAIAPTIASPTAASPTEASPTPATPTVAFTAPAAAAFTVREQEIVDALAALGAATLAQLVAATQQNRGSLHTRLQRLHRNGIVQITAAKGENIIYTLAPARTSPALPA